MTHVPPDLLHRIKLHGQSHVLAAWNSLTPSDRSSLVEQLAGIDFEELEALYRRKDEPHTSLPPRDRIAPLPTELRCTIPIQTAGRGEEAIRRGELAVLLVAGGQGSRLGFDKPKGIYPVGPVSGASLFQIHAEKVLALRTRYEAAVPFLVMTSPATHADTEAYFRDHDYFGLPRDEVFFFQQGTMPALDLATGQLLLDGPGSVFLSPNGHGGTLTALADSGLLADLSTRGVKHVFYFQVDNPLVRVGDPAFLGRHVELDSEVSSKIVRKETPGEKVGILSLVDGRCSILEYSDLPADMAAERDSHGALMFRTGSPAIHLFSVDFLARVTAGASGLPFHLTKKKVSYYDPANRTAVNPAKENALKFERFVFDALPLAERWLAVEVSREDEFSPLKNATGADSPETVRNAIIGQAGRWMDAAGIEAPTGTALEVSPLYALDADQFAAKVDRNIVIFGPTYFR